MAVAAAVGGTGNDEPACLQKR